MQIDHIFVATTPDAPEATALEALGLVPTYRRTHVGQGTANVCYCFENAFLEVLWVTSVSEARSESVARMRLDERAAWRDGDASPFGLAWRAADDPGLVATWPCRPPYLPAGVAIDVALDSDDVRQPLMFTFPGAQAPRLWPAARRGDMQAAAGFTNLTLAGVWLPEGLAPSPTVRQIAESAGAFIRESLTGHHALDVRLERADGDVLTLRLPECVRVD